MKNARPQTTEASALDTRNSNAQHPAPGTQPERLLATLLQGHRVNPLAAWTALGIYRLSDTVYQLRRLGWPVKTERLDVTNRFGEQCHVAEYVLPLDREAA